MKMLVLILLMTVSAQAQSVIYTIGPIPKAKIRCDTVTAAKALAAIQTDSGQIVRVVDNGDVNADGRVSNADIIYLKNFVLLKGPAPKGHLVFQLNDSRAKDSVTITCILVDSAGVKLK